MTIDFTHKMNLKTTYRSVCTLYTILYRNYTMMISGWGTYVDYKTSISIFLYRNRRVSEIRLYCTYEKFNFVIIFFFLNELLSIGINLHRTKT